MPKLNVYLPAELADAVRDAGLPVSAICQRALEHALVEVRSAANPTVDSGSPNRYTPRAAKVMSLATTYAGQAGHEVSSPFVLLALVAEGEGVAAIALRNLGVTTQIVQEQLEGFGPQLRSGDDVVPHNALREAMKLGHDYIGTEHLLLGLTKAGPAMVMLGELRVTRSAIKREVIHLLTGRRARPPAVRPTPDIATQLEEINERLTKLER